MASRSEHDRKRRVPRAESDGDGFRTANRERRSAAIGMEKFSSKRGHDRALQEFKKRKDVKFRKNAGLLREYKRAMKQEGYDAGRGASRKREEGIGVRKSDTDRGDDGELKSVHEDGDVDTDAPDDQQQKKRHKADPLAKARREAVQRKQRQEDIVSEKGQKELDESNKQNNRKKRTRTLMKRTRRGQPLMKNVIGDLLGKIKSDVGE